MKRFAVLLALLGAPTAALAAFGIFQTALPSNPNLRQENVFGLTGSAWQTPSGYYTPGTGNPAVSTADYYHMNGLSSFRPYDLLDSACGTAGSTIAASRGRYAWPIAPDHGGVGGWNGSFDFRIGFSNDPGVLPSPLSTVSIYPAASVNGSSGVNPTIATITAKIDNGAGGAGNTLTVTAVSGFITNDNHANVSGAGVTTASITAQPTGTEGLTGTYTINGAAQNVASQAMTVTQTNYNIYQIPQLVCNPDDASFPFYLYAEGAGSGIQHETGLIKSADLITWTTAVPSHVVPNFNAWSSYQRVFRDGVNSWHSVGFQIGYQANGGVDSEGRWTSPDGKIWTPGALKLNTCVPTNGPNFSTTCPSGVSVGAEPGSPATFTIGAQSWVIASAKTFVSSARSGNEWVSRYPVDANDNILASPSGVNISSAYAGTYPGPTYMQSVSGYVEDGIGHYWATTGFPLSSSLYGLVTNATYANGGGLNQQGVDYYTEIVDATAAAGAAPVGVQASCASSVATVNWLPGILPTDTMRLYRGTTAGSQTTLVGDFSGSFATDSGMTLNAVTYYKLVYLNAGVEKKNRVVSTYCSTSSAFVNAHLTRAQLGSADMTTCNRNGAGLSLDAFDSWLTSNGLSNNLLYATAADFCVAKSGSVITKIFDMGTTRLPRGGDYAPTTGSTTYNATGINSKPAWVNGTNAAQGAYGGGVTGLNNIRRKTQITLFAAYQKPGTAAATPFIIGQFSNRMEMTHASGAPGSLSCYIYDGAIGKTATATISGLATDVHTAGCIFDGTNWLAYSDAAAGSPQTGLTIPSVSYSPSDILTGQYGYSSNAFVLFAGSDQGLYNQATNSYAPSASNALYSGRAQMVFDKALTGAQITSLDALVR